MNKTCKEITILSHLPRHRMLVIVETSLNLQICSIYQVLYYSIFTLIIPQRDLHASRSNHNWMNSKSFHLIQVQPRDVTGISFQKGQTRSVECRLQPAWSVNRERAFHLPASAIAQQDHIQRGLWLFQLWAATLSAVAEPQMPPSLWLQNLQLIPPQW